MYIQIDRGFKKRTEAEVHGSILMTRAMLDHGGSFMIARAPPIGKNIMKLKDSDSS